MTQFFDGKAVAQAKLAELKIRVSDLRGKGIKPKLVSILVGDNQASELYTRMKKQAAESIGCELSVVSYPSSVGSDELKSKIEELNNDAGVNGIMIQLPLPNNLKLKTEDLIRWINPKKDVDGLRDDSPYVTPTAQAVLQAIKQSGLSLKEPPLKVLVVGASRGFEGKKIVKELSKEGYLVEGVSRDTKDLKLKTIGADVIVSVTGVPNLIKADMVKEGAVLIDIGAPNGDIEKSAYDKTRFVSPVPGGIGPVTISSLIKNLVESVGKI